MSWSQLRNSIVKRVQNVCWLYLTSNFFVTSPSDVIPFRSQMECRLVRIDEQTYARVQEFRSSDRVAEYCRKVAQGEIGFFAECAGKVVGSIWASINRTTKPAIVRKHIRLLPNEALIHDIVTGEQCKGQGIGPFMVSGIITVLFSEYRVGRVIIDVNRSNRSSLRMMEKVGLRAREQAFYVSILGRLAFEKTLRQDRAAC